jgi:hypothetical protein
MSSLSVTPLEQVLGSRLVALGAEQFEAESVGKPVGRVERGTDRQRVLDLLAGDTGDSTSRMSPERTFPSLVSLPSIRSVARSPPEMGADSRSASTA